MSKYFLLLNIKAVFDLYRYVIAATGKNGHITNFLTIHCLNTEARIPAATASVPGIMLQSKT